MTAADRQVEAFGRNVLGPVFGEFALRLHLFLLALDSPGEVRLLFCARGGLRLRLIYEAFLEAAEFAPAAAYADLMVSRLVAARTAISAGSPAAYEELGREFRDDTMGRVVTAITQRDLLDGEAAAAPFTPEALAALMAEDSTRSRAIRSELALQNRLFDRHLAERAGGARRLILCDTGLYGSTVRLLRAGRPGLDWSCILFARSNYKGFSESHFPVTVGLSVESNGYHAVDARTCVLRYWHLIESSLEPELPSVVRFEKAGGAAQANLVSPGWQGRLEGRPGELFAGVMAYLRALPRRRAAEQIYADAPPAWRRLHQAIVWPGEADRRTLSIGRRSRDFGRPDSVTVFDPRRFGGGLRGVQNSLWREGAVVDRFPVSRWLWLGALHAAHVGRGALSAARRKPAR